MKDFPLVLGTAGHIDHGKTWLVRALTGEDTDRLPEEKERGISIDLGYAPLKLPSGRQISIVDVPGHERFIRNMVAGATGIDLFLLIVDAHEGARAQTYEHLRILSLLGVERGVVAITKSDTVDQETLDFALLEGKELVPGAPVVATSSQSGMGLPELLKELDEVATEVKNDSGVGATRLFVDRSFTLKGIGTVVTGTLWSGSISEGDRLLAAPQNLSVRVRTVQVHDQTIEQALPGQRVALCIPSFRPDQIPRGTVLVKPGSYPVSYRVDIALEEFEPIANGCRLRIYHGTSENYGRIMRVGDSRAQLRLARPIVAARGDRVVLRAETTVGGGVVLDPDPPRKIDPGRFDLLEQGDPHSIVLSVLASSPEPIAREVLEKRGLLQSHELTEGLSGVVEAGGFYLTQTKLNELKGEVDKRLIERAESSPLDPGVFIAELLPERPWVNAVLDLLPFERRGNKAYAPGVVAALGGKTGQANKLLSELRDTGYAPMKLEDSDLVRYLVEEGKLVRVGGSFGISPEAYERAREIVVGECESSGEITLASFRDLIGEGRKAAQLLLESFDADGMTRRVGDARVLRRRYRGIKESK